MKQSYKVLTIIITCLLLISSTASAHSGRLDANGGHNCSEKSKQKGLCTGYHYHRGEKAQPKATKPSKKSNQSNKSKQQSSSSKSKKSSQQTATSKQTKSAKQTKQTKPIYQTSKLKLFYNGKVQKLQSPAVDLKGITYYPIREISEIIGATLTVDKSNSKLSVNKEQLTVVLDDKKSNIIVVDGKKYAPIRTIVEKLGITVSYKKETATIHLND
ncbi:stalk domain-containing protein [Paenibacillus yanchengensis]|uniref:Stalk domain-containing protein n=1 Tax=Paenibacillus yanchengensis TaxID=2035833 RepID=A0ABW4YQP8_9BACL